MRDCKLKFGTLSLNAYMAIPQQCAHSAPDFIQIGSQYKNYITVFLNISCIGS